MQISPLTMTLLVSSGSNPFGHTQAIANCQHSMQLPIFTSLALLTLMLPSSSALFKKTRPAAAIKIKAALKTKQLIRPWHNQAHLLAGPFGYTPKTIVASLNPFGRKKKAQQ
jgi:hypothetical protein